MNNELRILNIGVRLTKREFLISLILFFSFFTWYYLFSVLVPQHLLGLSADNQLIVTVSFNLLIGITLVLTSFFIREFNEIRIIYGSSIIISILSIALYFTSSTVFGSILYLLAGIFFSIGQLGSFTYFWSLTIPEERGRVGGLVGFFSLSLFYVVCLMAETFDFSEVILLCVILSSEILVIKLLNPEKKETLIARKSEKEHQPERRTILFYSIPWAVFSLINGTLAKNISLYILGQASSSFYVSLIVLQITGAIFGALIGGVIADFFGRKIALAFSLTLYGISSALVGLVTPSELLYFVYIANGMTWGILLTMYTLVLWGDLANQESYIKRYSTGMIIFYLAIGVGILLDLTSPIPLLFSSLLSCLLIFLSNVPLLLAPELLSSDFRERIKLRLYMNLLKKIGRKQSQNQG